MVLINIPNAPLKAVFFIHFLLSVWGAQGHWSPASYVYYNALLLIMLLWSIHHKDSEEPVLMAAVANSLCLFLDIITVSIYFPVSTGSSERFSVAMAIINMIGRPLSCLLLYRTFQERDGNLNNLGLGGNFGDILGSNTRSPYEDIDRPSVAQGLPQPSADVGSPTHFFVGGGNPPENKSPPPYQG